MSARYGIRQILYENGLEVPYELVPDGIRADVHDCYPNPALTHLWYAHWAVIFGFLGYKCYRVALARSVYKRIHPNRRVPWKVPYFSYSKAKWI